MQQPVIELDITKDDLVMFDDGDESGIYAKEDENFSYLILGHLKIKMTKEQEERLGLLFDW